MSVVAAINCSVLKGKKKNKKFPIPDQNGDFSKTKLYTSEKIVTLSDLMSITIRLPLPRYFRSLPQ